MSQAGRECKLPLQKPGISHAKWASMNLAIWLPSMFAFGIVSMVGCYLFFLACDKI